MSARTRWTCNIGLLAIAAASLPVSANAQGDGSPLPALQGIRTPESPAFILLGVSPTDIQRPTSPAAAAFSFLSSTRAGNSSFLPKDYALEMAPFWVGAAARRLTLDEYESGGVWRNLVRTGTVGFATQDSAFKTPDARGADTTVYRIGFGVRASPVRGRIARPGCVADLRERARNVARLVADSLAARIAQDSTLATDVGRIEELRARFFAQAVQAVAAVEAQCANALTERVGFTLDLAAAGVVRAPAQQFTGSTLSSTALWLTPAWLGLRASALGVLRVGHEKGAALGAGRTLIDVGGRWLGHFGQFNAGGETVFRRTSGDAAQTLWRAGLTFEARATPDVWLTSTLGRDYRPSKAGGLVVAASFQWNVGKPTLESPADLIRRAGTDKK